MWMEFAAQAAGCLTSEEEWDLGVMAGHSASKTRVNALMCRPSTTYFLAALKTWMPASAGMTT
jgi:hypothetical protein